MMRIRILLLAALICGTMRTAAQGFFNLTAEQVRIDSLLPYFTYVHELGTNYADSVYEVAIEYPEFINMTQTDILRYKRISNDSLPEMPVIDSHLSVSRKQGTLDISFMPLVFRDGKFQKLVSFKLNVKAVPAKRQAARSEAYSQQTPANRYADHSVLRSGSWAKIRVPRSGIYQLTSSLVAQAGFSDPSKVKIYGYGGALQPESLTDSYLRETDDLKEVPTCTVGGKRLFYAQGPVTWSSTNDRVRNPYSDYGYYFLTESDDAPLTIDETEFKNSSYPTSEHYNTLYEVDDYAWFHGGRNLYDSRVFTKGTPRDYSITAAGATGSGTLLVVLTADDASTAQISINDSIVGKITISKPGSYNAASIGKSTFRINNITETNKVTINQQTGGTMRLDYIALHCNNPCDAPDLQNMSFDTPEYVYRITNQDHHADSPADMIIIVPTTQKLIAQAERLKKLHEENDGMSVRIVPADELFNEFASGTPDATAYRRYMKMFYDRAENESEIPKYLVLFGDGAWDNRMASTTWKGYSPDDFLLCFESDDSFSEVNCYVSDDFFCMLDDGEQIQQTEGTSTVRYRGKADVAVGRFPVRTEEQAQIMVDKVVNYVNNKDAGSWQNTIVFMGDDGNNNVHMHAADTVAQIVERLYPAYDVKRVMWDAYTRTASATGFAYPDASEIIKQYIKNGALIMNYNGHGNPTLMSHEKVIQLSDLQNSTSAHLPLWITASCDIMPFDGQEDNLGEAAIFNKNGGAVAFYGTTRTVYSTYNERMNIAFTKEVLNTSNDELVGIGEAVRLAKNSLVNSMQDLTANKLQYTLLGDPALKLAIPRLSAVIDRINDIPADGTQEINLKAGMQVTVEGRVTENGNNATDFNGLITATVRDARQEIVCRMNDTGNDGTTWAFKYYDRPNNIFKGNDSIKGGNFKFTFVVPKDISYSDEAGQIIVYAVNNEHTKTASGSNDKFTLNGSMEFNRDSIGPSIYCYLNSSSFTNGNNVNSTPYFVAELYDDDGINASGSGIGHDLMLVIDGDMSKTYTLNDYFTFDFGTYKSGKIGFSIPQLTTGRHKLQFRAWDICNFSSTAELTFNVMDGIEPRIIDVDCTQNPAVTQTSFRITHDRIGSEMNVMLDIFDMAGRHLWTTSESGTATDNTMTIDWDLTVGNGHRLGTGVYIYRVRLSCEGSSYASKAKKLVILNNK